MSPSMESTTLHGQIEQLLRSIRESPQVKHATSCDAHWIIVRGIELMLECQKAILEERESERQRKDAEQKARRAEVITIATCAAAAVASIVSALIPLVSHH